MAAVRMSQFDLLLSKSLLYRYKLRGWPRWLELLTLFKHCCFSTLLPKSNLLVGGLERFLPASWINLDNSTGRELIHYERQRDRLDHRWQQRPWSGVARKLVHDHGERFHVLIGSRTPVNGEKVANDIRQEGHVNVEAVHIDVTDKASLAAAAKTVREKFGRLDVLHVNV